MWHDKDARKSRKGRDFRQTAFSNLADTSSGVFDPDDGGSGYTEDETIALSQTVDNASPFQITVTTQPNQCALGAGPGVGSGTPNTYVIEPGTSAQIDGLAPKRIGIPSADAGLLGSQVLQLGITAARGAVQAAAAAVMSGRNVRADQPASSTGSSTSDPGPTSSFESEAKSTATKATAGLVSGAESAAGPFLLGFFLDLIADSCAATGNKNPALWTMNVTTTGIGSGASIPFQSVNWQYAHGGADPYNPNPSSMSPQVARGLMGLTTNVIYEWADPGSDSETGTRSRAGAERAQDDNLVTLSGKQGAAVFDAGLTVIADWEYDSDDDKSCYFHTYLPAAFPGCHGEVKYFVGYDANSTAVSGPVRQGPATLLTTKYADGSVGLKCASPDWQMNLPWHLSMSGGSGTAGGSTQGPGLGDSYSMSQPPDSVPGAQGALMAGFWYNTESTTMSPFSNVPGFVVQAAQGTSLSEGVSQFIPASSIAAASANGPITQFGCSLKAFGALPDMTVPSGTVNMGLVDQGQGQAIGWWSAPTAAVSRLAQATTSTLNLSPANVIADGTASATVTVTLRDADNNPVTSASGDIIRISSDLGTVSAVTDAGNGAFKATVSSAVPGKARVTATLNGVPLTATASVTFITASPDRSTLQVSPTTVIADGHAAATATVVLRDSEGNLWTPTAGDVVDVTADRGQVSEPVRQPDGSFTADVTSYVSGPITVTATLNSMPIGSRQSVTFIQASPDQSTLTVDANVLLADGDDQAVATLTLRDAEGKPWTATSYDRVRITTNLGQASATTDQGAGVYNATISSGSPGTATISATVNGSPIHSVATVAFNAAQGGSSTSKSLVVVDTNVARTDIDEEVPVTIVTRDRQGRTLTSGGALVTVHVTGDFSYDLPVTDNGDGTYSATLPAQGGAADGKKALVRAFVNEELTQAYALVSYAGAPDPGRSTLTLSDRPGDGSILTPGGLYMSLAPSLFGATLTLADADGDPSKMLPGEGPPSTNAAVLSGTFVPGPSDSVWSGVFAPDYGPANQNWPVGNGGIVCATWTPSGSSQTLSCAVPHVTVNTWPKDSGLPFDGLNSGADVTQESAADWFYTVWLIDSQNVFVPDQGDFGKFVIQMKDPATGTTYTLDTTVPGEFGPQQAKFFPGQYPGTEWDTYVNGYRLWTP